MKCPSCGKWNPASMPHCKFCGTSLEPDDGFFSASARYLANDEYIAVLLDLIQNAHQSVLASMYVMGDPQKDQTFSVFEANYGYVKGDTAAAKRICTT